MKASKLAYKRILVGVDFSDASLRAFSRATDLAVRLGAEVDLVHGLEDVAPAPWSMTDPAATRRLREHESDNAREALDALAAREARVPVTTHVLSGAAHTKLLSFAKRNKVGLIVLSNVGRSRLVDVLVGSTAHRMLGRSTVPLLLVPTTAVRRRRPGASPQRA